MRSSPSAPYAVGGVLYRGSGVMAMLLVMCCVARLAGGFNLVRIAPSACTSGGSSSTTSSNSIPSRLSAVKTSSEPTSAVSSSRASRGQDDKFDWHKQESAVGRIASSRRCRPPTALSEDMKKS